MVNILRPVLGTAAGLALGLATVQRATAPGASVDAAWSGGGTVWQATAYCAGKRTSDGGRVREGVVAADPFELPFGSILQIHDDEPTAAGMVHGVADGTYVVADTGSAVVGRVLDIYMRDCDKAKRFGRRLITVWRLR